MSDIATLLAELQQLEGPGRQNPETGANAKPNTNTLFRYSNRLFGSPYQLLDSVDKRFDAINPQTGTEYLRHFLLHSPILHVRPGQPEYTGGENRVRLSRAIQDAWRTSASDSARGPISSLMQSLAQGTLFGGGQKLQKRMFGFRETYMNYMMYVNYMCRTIAVLLGLDKPGEEIPNGTFATVGSIGNPSLGYEEFTTLRWENYRMTSGTFYVGTTTQQTWSLVTGGAGGLLNSVKNILSNSTGQFDPFSLGAQGLSELEKQIMEQWDPEPDTGIYNQLVNKITSVLFMVEPVSFSESLSNSTDKSFIEQAIDGITQSIGSELAFITNSGAVNDTGLVGSLAGFLGGGIESAVDLIGGLTEPISGGFMTNLFSGALKSIKGQKMIYPEIYKSSQSGMEYEFTVTLSSPYGDPYNYYMNIVVPLMHLVCLAAPRMMTSNTIASPFLVQAYIPGMCTCQLGIVSQMNIQRNPSGAHVSVHGFPLTVKVTFTVKELYNHLAISPASDPASFLFNETLTDWMANMAGLIPSMDTYQRIRDAQMKSINSYFAEGIFFDDMTTGWLAGIERWFRGVGGQ